MPIVHILNWFKLAIPEPTDKNRTVQIGCHFEEASEMANAIGDHDCDARLHSVAEFYKKESPGIGATAIDRAELLDSLCDQIVTAVGVAHMFGMDIEGALNEVIRSNWSKFVDGKPQFDVNGKIAKPESYSPPNLEPFL